MPECESVWMLLSEAEALPVREGRWFGFGYYYFYASEGG